MEIKTLSINGSVTFIRVQLAKSFLERLVGLIGKKLPESSALLLYDCNSIHSFFMGYPIDAVFLSKNNTVIKIFRNIKPFRMVLPVAGVTKVLELETGTANTLGIKEKDTLTFE